MGLCTFSGCENKYYAKGYCRAHYQQLRATGEVKPLYGGGSWHRLSDNSTEAATAQCCVCGPVSIIYRRTRKRWMCANKRAQESIIGVEPHGLTVAEARDFRRGKECSICGEVDNLCVDHCHTSGAIRGVLCRKCNSGLGMFDDDVERLLKATDYLKKFSS